MSTSTVFCAWCGQHEFRIAQNTFEDAGIMVLTCPACGKLTTLGKRPSHELNVMPGAPDEQKPPDAG